MTTRRSFLQAFGSLIGAATAAPVLASPVIQRATAADLVALGLAPAEAQRFVTFNHIRKWNLAREVRYCGGSPAGGALVWYPAEAVRRVEKTRNVDLTGRVRLSIEAEVELGLNTALIEAMRTRERVAIRSAGLRAHGVEDGDWDVKEVNYRALKEGPLTLTAEFGR